MQTILIGHRGEPSSYPENSLAGFEAVLHAGAAYIETDVQLSADGVPVLCHDPDVMKLTGHDYVVMQTDYATLSRLPAGYPERFGTRFADARTCPTRRTGRAVETLAAGPRPGRGETGEHRGLRHRPRHGRHPGGTARGARAVHHHFLSTGPIDSYPRRQQPAHRLGSAGMVRAIPARPPRSCSRST